MRMALSSICLKPNGGEAQPTSTWPDMTAVSVADGLPVAVGFAFRPNSLMKASTIEWVEEPLVEYAMVLPSVSCSFAMPDSVFAYQKSAAPVACAPRMRTGAPFE